MGLFDFGKKKREREALLAQEEAAAQAAAQERTKAEATARAWAAMQEKLKAEEAQKAAQAEQIAHEEAAARLEAEVAVRAEAEALAAKEREAAQRQVEQATVDAEPKAQEEVRLKTEAESKTQQEGSEEEKKKGLFSRLWQGLAKTRSHMAGRVDELIESTEEIDEDFYENLVDILIMSDMGVRTSDKVITELKRRIEAQRITDACQARDILKQILKEIMKQPRKPLSWPMVMMVVGVNGVGKTTTIGKLAMRFKDARHSVVLAAADTFRAAAADQLEIWAQRAQVPLVRHGEGADPAAVVFDGIKKAKAAEADLLIVDTAGRLHNKKNLMEELRKISRIIEREYAGADVRTLLVIDATTGQNGLAQAREFSEVADVSGIVLTKLDGTAKGGIAVAIMDELKLPVLYIGVGEGIEDLQAFDADAFVDAIF